MSADKALRELAAFSAEASASHTRSKGVWNWVLTIALFAYVARSCAMTGSGR